jgi:hypothetical protein
VWSKSIANVSEHGAGGNGRGLSGVSMSFLS